MRAALRAEKVCFAYNGTDVLHDVDMKVDSGQLFTIIGPNGSGKTTLLRILAGLNRLSRGQVFVFGSSLPDLGRSRLARIMAMVPQTMPDHFPFTVRETVLMARAPRQNVLGLETRADFEAADRAMAYTGVDHLARRGLDSLSGGERQRAFIARAVCQEPDILLLDEPTASLDYAHQIRIMDLLARLCRESGTSVILVSHDLNLASMYADRIALLNGGRILMCGPPGEVFQPEILESAYGCRLSVDRDPRTGRPRILPIPGLST